MPLLYGEVWVPDASQSGSFIISEANFYRSRDRVTIAGGAGRLSFGTVLGRVSSSGKYVPAPVSASDGSEVARAILFEDIDASEVDVIAGAVVRVAEVFEGNLTYDASVVSDADIQTKRDQLLVVGINVRLQDDPAARAANNSRQTLGY